ncbi:UPF0412 protein yaaI Flags: Precursor [Salmonella enterica subsp. enterica serovar Dublin]|nr:UPF0412 protein yaaI Flags: Precursor [Salmonella enterica subsp. enterica serovar Dublin]
MRSVLTISAGLLFGLALSSVAHANDHKILGVIAMPRNETNDLALKNSRLPHREAHSTHGGSRRHRT